VLYLSGFHAIEERLRAGAFEGRLLAAKPGPRARELVALAMAQKVPVDRVGTFDLDRLAADHRGLVLQVEDASPAARSLEDYLAALGEKADAVVVILDEVTDPHNYGAILRCCDQFGVELVLTRRRRSARHADAVARTSAGADAWVPQVETGNLDRAVGQLKEAGFWVYAADMAGEPAHTRDLRGRLALVLGGEAGLSRLLREVCDGLLSIPTRGRLDSLNVSVAAGILLYEAARQRATGATGA